MTQAELQAKLDELLVLPGETEWVEFKEAGTNFDFEKLGRYFAALSNEANLKNQPFGWIVFGVQDKSRRVVGSNYRPNRPALDGLKQEVAVHTPNGLTFEEIHELATSGKRVILFQVPAAPPGVPTTWKGHYYGRNGESLCPLSLQEIERIRRQAVPEDWSAQTCVGATVHDLDAEAVAFARTQYKRKNPQIAAEIDSWDIPAFLNKARLAVSGRITRAAIILVGKEEAASTTSITRNSSSLICTSSARPAAPMSRRSYSINCRMPSRRPRKRSESAISCKRWLTTTRRYERRARRLPQAGY